MFSPSAVAGMIARSYLFVPGDRPDRFDKAMAAGADAVIVDLEDAVAPAKKTEARAAIGKWLSAERNILLRINADTTEWYREDLQLARAAGIAGILLSKAQSIDAELQAICAETGQFLLPQVETAQGFENAYALASTPGVQRLLFGTLDGVIAPAMGRIYKDLMPNCHLVFVYDAAHAISTDRPEAFTEVVVDFLERHEAFVISRAETVIHP